MVSFIQNESTSPVSAPFLVVLQNNLIKVDLNTYFLTRLGTANRHTGKRCNPKTLRVRIEQFASNVLQRRSLCIM
jgi:hypothetical protein